MYAVCVTNSVNPHPCIRGPVTPLLQGTETAQVSVPGRVPGWRWATPGLSPVSPWSFPLACAERWAHAGKALGSVATEPGGQAQAVWGGSLRKGRSAWDLGD